MRRKLISIAFDNSTSNSGYDSEDYIGREMYGVADDGSIWRFDYEHDKWSLWDAGELDLEEKKDE